MNRRFFLQSFGLATAGGIVAYSFPKIIIPKNIVEPINLVGKKEIYPEIINDLFFSNTINFAMIEKAYRKACVGSVEPRYVYANQGFFDYMERTRQIYNV